MQTSKADTAQTKFKLVIVPGIFTKLGEPELRQQLGLEVFLNSGGNTIFLQMEQVRIVKIGKERVCGSVPRSASGFCYDWFIYDYLEYTF